MTIICLGAGSVSPSFFLGDLGDPLGAFRRASSTLRLA
jgi:hypothetical protein